MTFDERRYQPPTAPTQFNVEALFMGNSRLVIPAWQREYAWVGENEVEDLLVDLKEFEKNPHRSNYLLGSIITFPRSQDRVVVDGQQRAVTLFVLLCALRTNLKKLLEADFPEGDAPESFRDTLDAIKRCVRHTTATSSFIPIEMEFGQGGVILRQIADDQVPSIDGLTGTQERILEAYDYVKTYLTREFSDRTSLRSFAVGVMQGVFLSEIRVSDLRQALEVFIKLNNRGKDLEDSDLVKNFLFQQVSEESGFDQVSSRWAAMSRSLRSSQGKAKLKTAEFFLRNWALFRKGSRLIGEFPVWEYWEEELKVDEVREQFLGELESRAKNFSNLIDSKLPGSNSDNAAMQGVKHLGGTQHLPLLLAGSHLSSDSFDHLSRLVNARTVAYVLSLERTQDFESLVPVWANKIASLPSDASTSRIDTVTREAGACLSPTQITNFRTYLTTLTYLKQKKKVKLVLAVIAKEYQRRIAQDDLSLTQYLLGYQVLSRRGFDIDHICPQSAIPENTATVDNTTLYHGLGNLVLVNGRQRDYQNQAPVSKVPIYKEGNLLSKCLVEFDHTADARTKEEWLRIQQRVPFALSDWGSAVIEKRRDFLIDEFIEILPDVIMGRSSS